MTVLLLNFDATIVEVVNYPCSSYRYAGTDCAGFLTPTNSLTGSQLVGLEGHMRVVTR